MIKGMISLVVFIGGVYYLTGYFTYFWALVAAFVITFAVRASWKGIWNSNK